DLPFMVLAVTRPDIDITFPRLWEGRDVHRVALLPLTRASSAELVRDALGAVGEDVIERICERAAGNAFFLEELIRAESERDGDTPLDSSPRTVIAVVQ